MHPVSGVLRSRPVNADQNKGYAQWESSLLLVSNPSLAMKIALMQLAADDLELLRSKRLATDRPAMIGRAEDGTVIHIFS
jgi:hypothetical protein